MRKYFRSFRTAAILLIIALISLIAFLGLYTKQLNAYKDAVPSYKLGMDLYGRRELIFKPSTNSESKEVYVDNEGKVLGIVPTDSNSTSLDSEEQGPEEEDTSTPKVNYAKETREIKDNEDEVLTKENFDKTKKLIQSRLNRMGVEEYNIRLNDVTGDLVLEVIDSTNFDKLYNLIESKGVFQIIDSQTGLILMTNDMLKTVAPVYNSTEDGLQAYLQIEFTKEGREVLSQISKQYVEVKTDDGTTTTYVELQIDGSTIMKTYFGEELTNGIIQITYGSATTDVSEFQESYTNVVTVANMLTNGPSQIKYNLASDNFVKAELTDVAKLVAYVTFAVALVCVVVYFAITNGKYGLYAGIANIGYAAVVTLATRYTGVIITYNSIIAYVLMIALNVIFLNMLLKRVNEYGTGEQAYMDTIKRYYVAVIPVILLSVIFTFMTQVTIASVGMVVFWSLFVQFVFNAIFTRTLYIGLDKSNDDSLERKIEENKKYKRKQAKEKKSVTKTTKKSTKKGADK